ncbi:MAG: hypothetical protein B6242_14515 [Anaerolineaceae bacterium 4572_78]|nr:MAG: hypothetical protein B6242_14515 [Anaerolineaceae bacterium 4572_78]
MKIRAITLFQTVSWPFDKNFITNASHFLKSAKKGLEKSGYEVQSLRLATQPFPQIVDTTNLAETQNFVQYLEKQLTNAGIDYISIGPVLADNPDSDLTPIQIIPDIIEHTTKVFASVLVSSVLNGINLTAIQETANVIHKIGQNTSDGFGNLQFAMLANVAPRCPFFPAAYQQGDRSSFGFALEGADLAVQVFEQAKTLKEAGDNLVDTLNKHAVQLRRVVDDLVDEHLLPFAGVDCSLAPFPETQKSIAQAIENLGVSKFGGYGTLFATAFLTNCLKRVNVPHVGYKGVMYPVLEDNILAQRGIEGAYTIQDLLLYSAVCGIGVDTVPIAGDTSPEQIASHLLDVATLAISLDKPLSVRLLPVPNLKEGDLTSYDFEYFAKSKVFSLKEATASEIFKHNSFVKF